MIKDKMGNFIERHPNWLPLTIMILAIILFGLFIYLLSGIGTAIFVPLIVGVFTIWWSKNLENRRYMSQRREEPYSHFIGLVYKILTYVKKKKIYPESEMLKDVSVFSEKLTLWGSKNVIEKWNHYRKTSAQTRDSIENLFILEDIIMEMREDIGNEKLPEGTLLSLFVSDIDKHLGNGETHVPTTQTTPLDNEVQKNV